MLLSPEGMDRLAKLIPMLASDKDGEIVATVRAIERTLKAGGKDWHALANALVGHRTGWRIGPSVRAGMPTTGAFNYADVYRESEALFEGPEHPEAISRKFGLPIHEAGRIEPWNAVAHHCLTLNRTLPKKYGGKFLVDWQKALLRTFIENDRYPSNRHVEWIERTIARLHQARDATARATEKADV